MRQNNRRRVFFKISVYSAALFVLGFLFTSFNLTNSAGGKINNLAPALSATKTGVLDTTAGAKVIVFGT